MMIHFVDLSTHTYFRSVLRLRECSGADLYGETSAFLAVEKAESGGHRRPKSACWKAEAITQTIWRGLGSFNGSLSMLFLNLEGLERRRKRRL